MNTPFTISDAIVKVTPGVKITVKDPGSLTSLSLFQLSNTQIFACDGLWQGIILESKSNIRTLNSTKIEDAEIAINASNIFLSTLRIHSTTFNRNNIGILLVQSSGVFSGPKIIEFSRNKFTCTSPLNGTIEQIGLAGIQTINVPISINIQNPSFFNWFEDLQFGILSEEGQTLVDINNFNFFNLINDGISIKERYFKSK